MDTDNSTGKISNEAFRETIWAQTGAQRAEVKTGPRYGTDVSVVSLPGGLALASASDPLSLVPTLGLAESAWLSVHLTANDLATTGYAPMYGQFVLNLPERLSDADFKTYWEHIHTYCRDIGLSITGGHTGRVPGQESTIIGGATFSLVAPADRIRTSNLAAPGQAIILTKGCAISSTAILALSFPKTVRHAVGQETWMRACEQFSQTSVLADGLAARESEHVRAMHDVTEGGVLGAVSELCHAAGCGASIQAADLPVSDAVQAIAKLFRFDPARSVGAGAMLMTCHPAHAQPVLHKLAQRGIAGYVIGHTQEAEKGISLVDPHGQARPLQGQPAPDPYWNAYFNAIEKEWK